MKIRSDQLNDQEIESIILFRLSKIIDYKNITGRSLENNQVLYDGFFYDLGNLIRRSDPNQKFLIDVNDIDENFYKIYIHYKIHRI